MELYYGTDENMKLLGEFETIQEAYKRMYEYIKEIGFKSYYQRMWYIEKGLRVIDYGSHTKFFYIKEK